MQVSRYMRRFLELVVLACMIMVAYAGERAPPDYTGISALIVSIGALLGVIGTQFISIMVQRSKDKVAADERAVLIAQLAANTAVGEDVKKAVDGQTSKLIAAVEAKASAEGKLEEKAAQAAGTDAPAIVKAQAIIDRAELVSALREALAGLSPAPPAPSITIEKVLATEVQADTVTTDTLVTKDHKK